MFAPTDGSPEMAAVASRRLGRTVETLLFHDLDEVEAYDGVWANACLLHVPRDELATVLAADPARAETGGAFYASYKTGDGDGRDTLNRYYNYPSPDWLRATYAEAGNWSSLSIESGEVRGFDDKMADRCCSVRPDPRRSALSGRARVPVCSSVRALHRVRTRGQTS